MSDHRTEPRRRGERLVQAIYSAVLAELAENGYAAVTMESVAQRARTGKASLYRRWPTRIELIMDAMRSRMPSDASMIDTGSLRSDLISIFGRAAAELSGPVGIGVRGILAESLTDAEQQSVLWRHTRGNAVEVMRVIIDRAIARGEVDPETINDQRLAAGPSILRYQLLLDNGQVDVEGLVDNVVLPLLSAASSRRPRPPESRAVAG